MNMKRSACVMLLIALLGVGCTASRASDKPPISTEPRAGESSSMSEKSSRDLFDRWERVWHEGQYDLIPSCVGSEFIRHDEKGDRTVTRDAYAVELAATRQERPDIRVVVYDNSFEGDRAWFRFAFKWIDPKSGEPRSRAGMQSYRIENGKLAETWLVLQPLGSAWGDLAQEHWTSPPPTK
jgi:hypothetical protein